MDALVNESQPNSSSATNAYLDSIYANTTFPSLVTRIKALFIDVVILLVIFTATSLFIGAFGEIPSFVKAFIFIFMFVLYEPILTSLTGSTLGHKMMNLKVTRYEDPQRNIAFGNAFLRCLIKGLLGWISFLTVTGNKRKRAMHDMASGSIMLVGK